MPQQEDVPPAQAFAHELRRLYAIGHDLLEGHRARSVRPVLREGAADPALVPVHEREVAAPGTPARRRAARGYARAAVDQRQGRIVGMIGRKLDALWDAA